MSATNRGAERAHLDQYPTPPWCVDRLMEVVPFDVGVKQQFLEPCAGAGSIIETFNRNVLSVGEVPPTWDAFEIDPQYEEALSWVVPQTQLYINDFLAYTAGAEDEPPMWDVLLTNPPYGLAMEFLQRGLCVARRVIMLLRVNFLESENRAAFMQENPPDVYVLPNRPSFSADGSTDATAYAWMEWRRDWSGIDPLGKGGRVRGSVRVLGTTPKAERLAGRKTKRKSKTRAEDAPVEHLCAAFEPVELGYDCKNCGKHFRDHI